MNQSRLEAITKQAHDLALSLAKEAPDWDSVLLVHVALATGLGVAIGQAYASCPSLEAKINTGFILSQIDRAAELGYKASQTNVAEWRLDEIVKEAGAARKQVQS